MRIDKTFLRVLPALVVLIVVLLGVSCSQYEYNSPQPGILEVRLRATTTIPQILPFTPDNSFLMRLGKLEARRSDNVKLEIYSTLTAIRRNPDGDVFNVLDTLARDSSFVMGMVYAPPLTYSGFEFTFTPDPFLIVRRGNFPNFIQVVEPVPPERLHIIPSGGGSAGIQVQEGRLTRVTVTLNLDSTLVRRPETFQYRPLFYISSIQVF